MDWLFYASAAVVLSACLVMCAAAFLRPQPAPRSRRTYR
jgi:hypothetical protein